MTAAVRRSPEQRFLRQLGGRGAQIVAEPSGRYRLQVPGRKGLDCSADVVAALKQRGLLSGTGNLLELSAAGRLALRRDLAAVADTGSSPASMRVTETRMDADGLPFRAAVNPEESPLGWLRRRTGADGRPLVDAAAFAAGERLRADYTRGQLMPRVTANWDAAVVGRGRGGGQGGIVQLTDAALAARRRVENAVGAAGPELGSLLIDFCCFLKGLEEIERERRWPARSAKVVLTVGLAALARHYGLAAQAQGRGRSKAILHWGAEGYRPMID